MLMLTELCPDAEHDVDIDINLLHHLDQQMAGYCWGDSELIHIDLARHSYDTTFTRDDILLHLTHELIHAKQYFKKELSPVKHTWKGKDHSKTSYARQPWEKEAYKLECKIYNMFWCGRDYFIK